MYVDEGNIPTLIKNYIKNEQVNTIIDLNDRIKPYDNEKNCEILIDIDGTTFAQEDYKILMKLPEIIKDSGSIGRFALNNLKVEIVQMNEYQKNLIKL